MILEVGRSFAVVRAALTVATRGSSIAPTFRVEASHGPPPGRHVVQNRRIRMLPGAILILALLAASCADSGTSSPTRTPSPSPTLRPSPTPALQPSAHSIDSGNLNSNGAQQHSKPDSKRFPQPYASAIPHFNLAAHHAEPNAERQTRPSANGGSVG